MATVKLTYFNATGRAEPIRFLLTYGGLDFEDERLRREEFDAKKESFPFAKVPVLEIDGMTLYQSVTICRYLGQKFGLTGKDSRDVLQCEMLADTINDVRAQMLLDNLPSPCQKRSRCNDPRFHGPLTCCLYPAVVRAHYFETDETIKQQKKDFIFSELNRYLTRLDAIVAKNGGHFIKGQLSWPDFLFAAQCDNLSTMAGQDLFADFPALRSLRATVLSLPAIEQYIEKRPKTAL